MLSPERCAALCAFPFDSDLILHEAGIPSVGLWAQVPHYISGAAYPAASLAVVYNKPDVAQRFVAAHTDAVTCLAMHPDGVLVAPDGGRALLEYKCPAAKAYKGMSAADAAALEAGQRPGRVLAGLVGLAGACQHSA